MTVSAQKYVQALVAVRDHLDYCAQLPNFDLLAAITSLNRYESVLWTSPKAWIQHAGALSRMIQHAGPEHFRDYPTRAILDANRYRIIHEAYYRRKRTFLYQGDWADLDSGVEGLDAQYHELQRLYGRLAGLAEDITHILETHDLERRRFQRSTEEADMLLTDLDTWAAVWTESFKVTISETFDDIKTSIYADSDGLIFTSTLDYPGLRAGMGFNMYRCLKLTVLEWRHKLHHPSWTPGNEQERMFQIPKVRQLATDTYRSLHIHFTYGKERRLRNMYFFLFCLRCAAKVFHRRSRESRWAVSLLTDVADLDGFEMARSLTALHKAEWECTINSHSGNTGPSASVQEHIKDSVGTEMDQQCPSS